MLKHSLLYPYQTVSVGSFLCASFWQVFCTCLLDFLIEFQDAAEEIRDSPMKTTPDMEKNDAESGLSLSSSEERDLENFEEGSPVIQGHKCMYTGTLLLTS